ncbi:TIGR02253 family HAD-type hydrolase [Candidatus Micrarchaeota archaeon]|nr:TIGR02253 family HAD-type hydrolase [Candidatus Micrarchaeota archaeon]
MAIILFDIDDTLFPSTDFSSLARKNALNAMIRQGLETDYEKLDKELQLIIKEKGSNYQKHFDELCSRLNIKNPVRYIAAAIAAYHDTKTSIQPFPKVPFILLKLKEKGHHLYVATTGSSIKQWDKLIRLGIGLYFDGVFVTEEKKDEEFYRQILEKLGSKPSDCIMIGDREDTDITPAKNIGITTIRILKGKHIETPSDADYVIKNMKELLIILLKPSTQ